MSKKMTFQEFMKKYLELHGELKYEFDESTFINSHTPMRVICKKHGEFWKTPKNILKYDCWQCSYEKRSRQNTLTTEDFVKKAKKIHGDKYDYSESIYVKTKTPINIKCPKHGIFKQTPNDHLSGKGCPICNESHLEREVRDILNKNNINYIWQYKNEWLNRQSLDFFLPDYDIAIECQGKQHFGHGGWGSDFDYIFKSDLKKYDLLIKNNIHPIYFVNEKDINLINENKIYKNNIATKNNLIKCIQEKKLLKNLE